VTLLGESGRRGDEPARGEGGEAHGHGEAGMLVAGCTTGRAA
jgi:hypothetical protein